MRELVQDDFKMRYQEPGIANGDPVIVMPGPNSEGEEPITLGTGFEDYMDLANQLEFSTRTGKSTKNITESNAQKLKGMEDLHIFAPWAFYEREDNR